MRLLLCFLLSIILFSCAIKIPDIKVTGEKTALENQTLGDYKEIREDAFMISSKRKKQNDLLLPKDKKEVILALKRQKFNLDQINEYKIKQLIGEDLDGLLKIVYPKKLREFSEIDKKFFDRVFYEEIQDRQKIIKRLITLNTETKNEQQIREEYFEYMLKKSPLKTLYRDKKSHWQEKEK